MNETDHAFGSSSTIVVGKIRDITIIKDDNGYLASMDIGNKVVFFRTEKGDMNDSEIRIKLAREIFNLIFSVSMEELKIQEKNQTIEQAFYKKIVFGQIE